MKRRIQKMTAVFAIVGCCAALVELVAPSVDAASPAREWIAGDAWSVAVMQRDPAGNRAAGNNADAWLKPVTWNYTVAGETVINGATCWRVAVTPDAGLSVEEGELFFSKVDRTLVRVVIERHIRDDVVLQELNVSSDRQTPMMTTHASFPFDWPVLSTAAHGMAAAMAVDENDSRTFTSGVALSGRRVRRDTSRETGNRAAAGMAVIRRAPIAIQRSVTQRINRAQPPASLGALEPASAPLVVQAINASRTWQVTLGDRQSDVNLFFAEQLPWWFYKENATMKAWLVAFHPAVSAS